MKPPGLGSASNTVTAYPSGARSRATVTDEGPAPTQATRRPLRRADGRGIRARTSPLWSAATRLSRQMATGCGRSRIDSGPLFRSTRPRRQAGSQGRSQVRPRIPGNTLLAQFTMYASACRPCAIRRMYSGTGVCAGQAHWQSTTRWKVSGWRVSVGSKAAPVGWAAGRAGHARRASLGPPRPAALRRRSTAPPGRPGRDNPRLDQRTAARAFAPASVGNIGVGFDLLGHVVDGPRDVATVRRIDAPVVRVDAVRGDVAGVGAIPLDAPSNTAGRALLALREALGLAHGFAIELDKGIPLGSGLGGSAASCVAALVAANALLPEPLAREALYPFALEGEWASTHSRQGDNVGPMLVGGVALATPDRLLRLDVPDWLHCVVVQ